MRAGNSAIQHSFSETSRLSFFIFLLFLFILAFAFQGSRGIYSPDEGFYIGIAKSMLDTHNYLVPTLNEEVWLDKPPLSMWGIAAGLRIFGNIEFGARAFIALSYLFTAVLVYLLGCTMKDSSLGFCAGVIYSTMALPFISGNICTPDTPLTLFTTACLSIFWCFYNRPSRHGITISLLFFLILGLGFLTKGPAVFIPTITIACFVVIRKNVRQYFTLRYLLPGILLFCLIGLGWYIYIGIEIPGAISYFFDNQFWGRTVSSKYSRNTGLSGALIYIPTIILGALPWSFFWLTKLWKDKFQLSKYNFRLIPDNAANLFLALWILIPLLLLTIASSRLPLYALPIFPAIALATAKITQPLFWQNPEDSKLLSRSNFKMISLTGWILILLSLKLFSAYYPIRKDMRALFREIHDVLPKTEYEVVSINEHLEGLSFYLDATVEPVTTSDKPYPFFILPEHLQDELAEINSAIHTFVFISKGKASEDVRRFLYESGHSFREYPLQFQRHLLIVE